MNDQPQKDQIELQHVIDILRYCMRQYAVTHDLDTDQMKETTIENLVEWCKQEQLPLSARFEICQHTYDGSGAQPSGSKITSHAVDTVWKQLQNPYAAVKLLLPIWVWIVDKRPPLEVRPIRMEVTAAFIFINRTAMQITINTPFNTRKPIGSGFVASLLYDQAINMVNSIGVNGLDAMREKYSQPLDVPPGMEHLFDGE